MSNEIFPELPGIAWGTEKEPQFDTRTVRAVSGYEVRLSRRAYPLYLIKMKYEFLRTDSAWQELQQIIGLFLRHKGSGDSFLLLDANDNTATNQVFGVGNGSQTVYQLTGTWGGMVQPVRNIRTLSLISLNGDAVSASSLSFNETGVVTFFTPPPAGSVLTWSGTYYYRCRFADDRITPKEMMRNIWDLGRCELVGGLGRQIG